MAEIYDRFRNDTAPRLLRRFDQEGTQQVIKVVTPNPDPTLPPDVQLTYASIPAVVRGVSAQLAAATPDLETTDLQVIVAQVDFDPETAEQVQINGVNRRILRVDAIPAAGVPVAYRFYVR